MAVFVIFFMYPFVYAIYISFFDWGILGKNHSDGLDNYCDALARRDLPQGDQEHALYTVVVVPLEMALGLSMALVVNAGDPRQDVLPLRVLLPVARLVGRDHDDRDLPAQRGRPAQPDQSAATARGSATSRRRSGRSSA